MHAVNSELMGSSCYRNETYSAYQSLAIAIRLDPDLLPMSNAHLPQNWIVLLSRFVLRIVPECKLDLSGLFGDHTIYESYVLFLDSPLYELDGEVPVGFLGECKNEQTRCVHIETVNRWLLNTKGKEAFQSGDHAILFIGTTTRYREESGGLVHHYYLSIAIDDI